MKDCFQQIRERGDARAHECSSVDVDEPKAECTSKRRETSSVLASFLCDVHYDTVRSDRGQRWLSDQGGELSAG